MNPRLASMIRSASNLAMLALMVAMLVFGLHALLRDRIGAAERKAEMQAMAVVLPMSSYDNDPVLDSVQVHAPAWLGTDAEVTVRRARLGGHARALVLQAVAPDGYNGPISLLIGVDHDGRITGVRVSSHRETAGLGDAIDIRKSPWIRRFDGRSLGHPSDAGWAVKSEGGDFDQFAGATTTPRAVVKAVHRVLGLVRKHGDRIYSARAGTQLRFDDAPETPLPHAGATP